MTEDLAQAPADDGMARIDDAGTLVIRRWLPGPADRVWRYLTDGELRAKWLASGDLPAQPGGQGELVWHNDEISAPDDPRPDGMSAEIRMQTHVIACDPPRLLTIGWGKGDVTFRLDEAEGKTLLTLTHRGLTDPDGRANIAAGWHMHLDIMADVIAGRQAPSFWSGWRALHDRYAAALAG